MLITKRGRKGQHQLWVNMGEIDGCSIQLFLISFRAWIPIQNENCDHGDFMKKKGRVLHYYRNLRLHTLSLRLPNIVARHRGCQQSERGDFDPVLTFSASPGMVGIATSK